MTHSTMSSTPSRVLLALAAGMALLAPGAQAASARATALPDPSSPEAVYRQERAKCLDGRSQQDRATCLQEAGAALAEARRGRLDNREDAATLARNALLRCQRQRPEDRPDCERLARGEGSRSGSVEGGGVIKEIVTRTVGPAPAPTPAPAPVPVPAPQR